MSTSPAVQLSCLTLLPCLLSRILGMNDHDGHSKAGDVFPYAPETKANAISFQEVCDNLFEKMKDSKTMDSKLNLLGPFLSGLGKESAFPFMRLILPELDNLRDKYGAKMATLARIVAQMYFRVEDKNYKRLQFNTDPVQNPSPAKEWQITGDFPLTVEYVLTHAPGIEVVKKTDWTLGKVNETLDDLAKAKNDSQRAEVLRRMRVDCSPMNQKWILRIILKTLKISLKKNRVLERFHPDAMDEYSKTTSLKKVCSAFIGRHSSIRSKSDIEVFTSFSPMLATNFFYKIDRIVPSFQGRPLCMDVKLDGERMLCHKDGDEVKWFTRNAKDYTEKYGGVLTPHVLAGVTAHKCILDGEVVTWDDLTGSMVPFGKNRTYAKEEIDGGGSGTRWLFYVVFDIVYVGGEGVAGNEALNDIIAEAARKSRAPCAPGVELKVGNLTALHLDARRRILRSVMTEKKHRLEFVKSLDVEAGDETDRKKQVMAFFNQNAIHLNEEGLVIKDLRGHYMLGDKSRKCGLWVKMKPEYSDQTADIDLIVLAGGFASGAMRSGLLSRFLLGVAVPTADGSPAKKFWPVTKVGTGFNMAQLEELNERLKDSWKSFDNGDPTHFDIANHRGTFRRGSGGDGTGMARWIAPEDSICLEIKCMEIVQADDWPGVFCTMRFPRVTRIRYDKGAEGSLDTTRLVELKDRPRLSAANSQAGGGSGDGASRTGRSKRQKGGGRGRGGASGGRQVSELFASGGGSSVAVERNIFVRNKQELEMCVVGTGFSKAPVIEEEGVDVDSWWASSCLKRKAGHEGDIGEEKLTMQDVGNLIRANGGVITANPEVTTAFVIVGDKNTIQVKNVIAAGKYNVVGYRWVLKCIKEQKYDFPTMLHVRAMSPACREAMSSKVDEYGDDYKEDTNTSALSQLLLNIPENTKPDRDRADRSWLSPLMEMDPQDRTTFMDGPDFLFADTWRVLVYCDLFPDLGSPDPPNTNDESSDDTRPNRNEIPHNILASTVAAVRLYGGNVAPSLHAGVTHVVMDPQDSERHALIRERINDLHSRSDSVFNIRLVTPEWAWRCIDLGRLEPPKNEHKILLVR